jgi:hypothetical protein
LPCRRLRITADTVGVTTASTVEPTDSASTRLVVFISFVTVPVATALALADADADACADAEAAAPRTSIP